MIAAVHRREPRALPRKAAPLFAGFLLLIWASWAPGLFELPGGMAPGHVMAGVVFMLVLGDSNRLKPAYGAIRSTAVRIVFGASLFICIWALLSGIQAEDPLRIGRPIVGFGIGPLLYFVMVRVVTPNKIDRVIEVLAFAAVASVLISLAAIYVEPLREIAFGDRDRAQAFFKHPNQFAIALSAIAPVVMVKALSGRSDRAKWAAILVLIMIGFVFAGSKANTGVALISGFLIALFGSATYRSAGRAILFALFVTIVGAGMLVVAWELVQTFNPRMGMLLSTLASGNQISSMIGRYYIWEVSMREFYADPLFGQGGGAMLNIAIRDDDITHSHNVVLDIMRTLGVPGMVAILAFCFATMTLIAGQLLLALRLKEVDRLERMKLVGLALGVFGYLLANMSSDSFGPSTSPIFWMVFALSLFQARKVRVLYGISAQGTPSRRHLPAANR